MERLRARLDDAALMLELAEAEADSDAAAEVGERDRRAAQGDRRARGPHPALRRVRLARGAGDHPVRRRRRRRGRLRRDAAADVPALGGAARLRHRGLRHLVRRGGRAQVGHVRGQGAVRVRHALASSRAPTGWCGSARSTTRAAGRPRFAAVEVRAGGRADRRDRHPRGRHPGRRLPLVRARAVRASTRPTRRCGSPTSPPASW